MSLDTGKVKDSPRQAALNAWDGKAVTAVGGAKGESTRGNRRQRKSRPWVSLSHPESLYGDFGDAIEIFGPLGVVLIHDSLIDGTIRGCRAGKEET